MRECMAGRHLGHPTRPIAEELPWMRQELRNTALEMDRRAKDGHLLTRGHSADSQPPVDASKESVSAPAPPLTAVEDRIAEDFQRLREALSAREAVLLQTVAYMRETELKKHQYCSRQRLSHYIFSCQALSASIATALECEDAVECLQVGAEVLLLADEIRRDAEDIRRMQQERSPLVIEYILNSKIKVRSLSSLGAVVLVAVCPQASLCVVCGDTDTFVEGDECCVDVLLRDYQADPMQCGAGVAIDGVNPFSIRWTDTLGGLLGTEGDTEDVTDIHYEGGSVFRITFPLPRVGEYHAYVLYCGIAVGKYPLLFTVRPPENWSFGSKGKEIGQFLPPWGVSVGDNGRLFISDCSNSRVQVFDKSNGSFVYMFGEHGLGTGMLRSPRGLCCSSSGLIYVVDAGNCRVQVYTQQEGAYVMQLFEKGTGPGYLCGPWGVAEGCDGNIYVSDMNGHTVQVMTPSGQFIRSIGSIGSDPGELLYPRGIACSADGVLYVADRNNNRVQAFHMQDGSFIMEIVDCAPMDVTCGPGGEIYISDFDNGCVQIFSKDGDVVKTVASKGSDRGQLQNPCGLFCAESGELYIADAGNYRIQVFNYLR